MEASNPIEELAKRLSSVLPGGSASSINDVRKDIEGNLQSGIKSGLRAMNLVTREEFEIQNAVLLRTREKLEKLEKQVAELESALNLVSDTDKEES